MTRIYTKTGDQGQTGLFGGGRVSKASPRVDVYGELDELNATLGLARSQGLDGELDGLLETLQAQLFSVGSRLATPVGVAAEAHLPPVRPEWVTWMEGLIDRFDEELPAMKQFILPGGTRGASALHLARCVCRRVERRLIPLLEATRTAGSPAGSTEASGSGGSLEVGAGDVSDAAVDAEAEGAVLGAIVVYLNRLSDLLFTLARVDNRRSKVEDVPWRPV